MTTKIAGNLGGRPGQYGRPELSQQEAVAKYTFSDRVIAQLQKLGIAEPPRPVCNEEHERLFSDIASGDYYDGRMPLVIKKFELDDLSVLLTLLQAWLDYVTYQHTYWAMKKAEAFKQATIIDMKIRKVTSKSTISDQKVRDEAKVHPDFIEYDAEGAYCKAMSDMLAAQVKIISKNISICSREVTIREQILQRDLRQRGFAKKMTSYVRQQADIEYQSEEEDHDQDNHSRITYQRAAHAWQGNRSG